MLGLKFIVKIDNAAISHFLTQSKLILKQARCQEFVVTFNFHFEHKLRRSNQATNALSRKEELAALRLLANMSASVVNAPIRKHIRENLEKDLAVRTILKLLKEGKARQFWVNDGLLWAKGGHLYILRAGDLRRVLLKSAMTLCGRVIQGDREYMPF